MTDNQDREQPDNGKFCGGTFLYIRDHPADDGSVPLPAGLPHWLSPDITVIRPGGARGDEAVVGQVNQVEVIVTNDCGVAAMDVFVDAFVADPGTAFTPATATLVGGGFLTVPSYGTAAIAFPWVPGAAQAGHRCLLARASLLIPPDTYADGTIFDVRGDRHVAQRNISVVALAAAENDLKFAFAIVNPFLEPMAVLVRADEVREEWQLAHVRDSLGCQFAQFGETPLREIGVALGPDRAVVDRLEAIVARLEEARPLARMGRITNAFVHARRADLELRLDPGEVRQGVLYIERNRETRRGDLHVVEVRQLRDGEELVGGLTVVVVH